MLTTAITFNPTIAISVCHKGSFTHPVVIHIEDSHPTTHQDPTYKVHNSIFYCVANMPGAVPATATFALANATIKYGLTLANKGWEKATADDACLAKGLNVHAGKIYYDAVAKAHNL